MKIFNGKKMADEILKETSRQIKKEKLKPALAVILIGENEASKIYVKIKKQTAAKIGIKVHEYLFSDKNREGEIIARIEELNGDEKISGIIVQLPLPAIFNADKIIDAIDPAKDVDGFQRENRQLLEKGEVRLAPVLPSAIALVLESALGGDFKGRIMIALVNSEIFGRSLKTILTQKGAACEYLVRNTCVILGSEKEIKSADVLISACGCPNFIKADMIKEGAILVDAGVTRWSDGQVVGDFDRESVKSKAAFLTPVPGGIGPLTVALLLRNVYLAAKK